MTRRYSKRAKNEHPSLSGFGRGETPYGKEYLIVDCFLRKDFGSMSKKIK